MSLDVASTRKIAVVLGLAAAIYFGVHVWFVVSGALALDSENRAQLLDESAPTLAYWTLFIVAGAALAALAQRFHTFKVSTRRAVIVAMAILGVLAGSVAEWWTSLYYLVPALALALSRQGTASPEH